MINSTKGKTSEQPVEHTVRDALQIFAFEEMNNIPLKCFTITE